jgi:hypothetical protein
MLTLVPGDKLLVAATGVLYNYALGFSCFHVLFVNTLLLPKELQPGLFRKLCLVLAGCFFSTGAILSTYVELPKLIKLLSSEV